MLSFYNGDKVGMIAMKPLVRFCPHCHMFLTMAQLQRAVTFECPACHCTLRCMEGWAGRYARQIVVLLVIFFYTWKHGWDGGFVIFLFGFYAIVGLLVYVFFVEPFLPYGELQLVASPIAETYLNAKPLSEKEYNSRGKSLRPLGIT